MRRDDGTIYEHKGTRKRPFEVKLTAGKRRTIGYYATKSEARAALRQAIRDRDAGHLVDGGGRTLGSYLAYWLTSVKADKLRAGSLNRYACRLGYVHRSIGHVPLRDLSAPSIRSCYATLRDEHNLSPRTIQMTHGLLSSALKHAVREGLLTRNPCDLVDAPRAERYEGSTLTRDEVRTILAHSFDSPYYPLWVLLLTTGMRIGEALALRWDDLHGTALTIERTTINLPGGGQTTGQPKTEKSRRTIDLPKSTLVALEAHKTRQAFKRAAIRAKGGTWEEQNLIFPNTMGGLMQKGYAGRLWTDMLKELELPHRRLHDIRHTVATYLVESGVTLQAVQGTLGHARLSTTLDFYSHLSPQMRQGVTRQLDELVALPSEEVESDAR